MIPLLSFKCKSAGLKYCNDHKAFSEYLNDMDGIYKNISTIQYSRNKKRKKLIKFDGIIANMLSNKKRQPVITDCMFLSCHVCVSEWLQLDSNPEPLSS